MASFALFDSCQRSSVQTAVKEPILIEAIDNTVKVNDLTKYIKEIHYLEISEDKGSKLFGTSELIITEDGDFIASSAKGLFLVKKDGKVAIKYGAKGKGPGEYTERCDFSLSLKEDEVIILDRDESLLRYSRDNGTFIGKTKPDWEVPVQHGFGFICPAEEQGYFFFRPQTLDYNNYSQDFFCLTKLNKKGKVISEYIKRTDFIFNFDFISQGLGNSYFLSPLQGRDTLYRIRNGKVIADYCIRFGSKTLPHRHIYTYGEDAYRFISTLAQSDYYKFLMGFKETDSELYFTCVGPSEIWWSFLIDKKSLKGIRWTRNSPGYRTFPLLSNQGSSFIGILEDNKTSAESDPDPLKKYCVDNLPANMDPTLNPVLFYITFDLNN